MKIARSWRIRRSALEEFMRRSEQSQTLVGQLSSFLKMPDNVLGITQTPELMLKLDIAFFQVGEVRGATMVKYQSQKATGPSADDLCAEMERVGLGWLEDEGRFFLREESEPQGGRINEIERLVSEIAEEDWSKGRSIWVNFNWVEGLDVDKALEQQQAISELVEDSRLAIKTSVLERELDRWPGAVQRRAQVTHSGTIWLSESGLALSRVLPPPAL